MKIEWFNTISPKIDHNFKGKQELVHSNYSELSSESSEVFIKW